MATVIGVRFKNGGKIYHFDPVGLYPTAGDSVIVETSRGVEIGQVASEPAEIDDAAVVAPLKKVIRIATPADIAAAEENTKLEQSALAVCEQKVADVGLDMKLVGCEYAFDRSKIVFYFTSDGRVDFRELVRVLAQAFHTRIELRQIGVRDETKMLGGLGACGQEVCCRRFLNDFQPVTIRMVRDQGLSLNPAKISGLCGRLMCCLKYEQEAYERVRKLMPKVGKTVGTPDGDGVVVDINVLKEKVKVNTGEVREYDLASIVKKSAAVEKPTANEEEGGAQ